MKTPKIGDVIEIKTERGLAYAQYTHHHKKYGSLIRVIKGFHEQRPSDLVELVNRESLFQVFFPLRAAVSRKILPIIGSVDTPLTAKSFPIFRNGFINPSTKKVTVWWLWDGENEWKVGELTDEQRKYPILEIWNDTLLIERIEEGWMPEVDSE